MQVRQVQDTVYKGRGKVMALSHGQAMSLAIAVKTRLGGNLK